MMKTFFGPDDVDRLGFALMNLAKENWAMKERLMLLEDALQQHLGMADLGLDTIAPDGVLAEKISAERQRFTASVLNAFKNPEVTPNLDDDSS